MTLTDRSSVTIDGGETSRESRMNAPVRDWLSPRMTASGPKRDRLMNPPLQYCQESCGANRAPSPIVTVKARNRAKSSRPFPFEYKKEDEGARNEFDAGSKADQHSSIPRGDDKEVNDDQSNQHEVDLPEENVSREGLERQTGHCHNACGGKGHSKASSAHDHYKQIAADRHRREDPACVDVPQQFERDKEQGGEGRVGEGLALHAHTVERLVAHDRGGSTDVHIEIDPDALADSAPAKPEENSDHAGHDHVGQ